MRVVIVGAGLAGLTCAKVLTEQAGSRVQVQVYERDAQVGGRVQTDEVEGFRLDRGFQVLFTAYPAVQRQIRLGELHPCAYRPGAVLVQGQRQYLLGDPWRDVGALFPSLANPLVSWVDKLRVLGLRWQLRGRSYPEIVASPESTMLAFWQHYGFSQAMIQHFFRPFYQGIVLDPQLETSSHLFQFYFQMLAAGAIVTPALGMGSLSQQLAAALPSGSLHCQTSVEGVWWQDGRVGGVMVQGEPITADVVVWATDTPTAARVLELSLPTQPRGVTTLYFTTSRPLSRGAYLHLNASGTGLINHAMELTQVSPALAPPGQHLWSVSVVGDPDLDQATLVARCRQELTSWFPQALDWTFLRCYRIPFAQFAQPVGFAQHLALPNPKPGLILAGEYTQQSSIQGSLASGEMAAQLVLEQLATG